MKNQSIFKIIGIFIFFIAIVGCTPLKKQIYLQKTSAVSDTLQHTIELTTIQPNDLLYIKILGLDEKTINFFNVNENSNSNSNYINEGPAIFLNSYSVDDSGFVHLPIIGAVLIQGLTLKESSDTIQMLLNKYLTNTTVIVKLANFKITVLGEVKNPGTFTIYDNEINLLEALGKAGDISANGNRKNIKLIRKFNNGKNSEIVSIDITNREFTQSNYYFLKSNDILYIEPVRAKNYQTNPFPVTTLLSILTTAILIVNYISK